MVDYTLYGALGSPYTMKMRAVLRYKRLPFLFKTAMGGQGDLAEVRPAVIPVLKDQAGEFHVDSTPMLTWLEQLHPSRAIISEDTALRFIDLLLEDFADEWLTKIMFRYRWATPRDQLYSGRFLAFDMGFANNAKAVEAAGAQFGARQIGRMDLIGCGDNNAAVLESSFEQIITTLDGVFAEQAFLFGSRPSRADFALYGQLSQLAADITPSELFREKAPFAYRWLSHIEDAAGVEADADHRAVESLHDGVKALLKIVAELYLPYLMANAMALLAMEESFEVNLNGKPFTQPPFKYQGKCLRQLGVEFAALNGESKQQVASLLGDEAIAILKAAAAR